MTYIYSHLAFYVLLVTYGGPEYGFRISGGYDSCLVIRHIVLAHNPQAQARCMSGIEWDKTDRPGRRPDEREAP